MDDFVARQHTQIRFKIRDFREGRIDLNSLIQQLEGLARAIGQSFWADHMFSLVLDLERINSEVIDKRRNMTSDERQKVEALLRQVETLIKQ